MATWRIVWEEVKPESGRWVRRLSEKHKGKIKDFSKAVAVGTEWKGLTEEIEYKMLVDTEVVLLSNNCWVYIRLKVNWVAEFELPIWESMVYNDGIWSYKSIGDIAQGKYSFIFWMFIIFKLFFMLNINKVEVVFMCT